ncbi:MAG TPA: aldo/keto reductase, partial [Steroidobacteraceae bacterium]|nr:aldo/keto reductase [Steroidobacteraceae bacterium]
EGSLTGSLTLESKWPAGDWRNLYFGKSNLAPTVERVEALRPLVPPDMTMAELALRFAIADPRISTVIPGMRSVAHVAANIGVSDGRELSEELRQRLRTHRWDRAPTKWSH